MNNKNKTTITIKEQYKNTLCNLVSSLWLTREKGFTYEALLAGLVEAGADDNILNELKEMPGFPIA